MPAAIAIPLITAAASSTAAVVGSKMASSASTKGAQMQTDAAREAARLQTEAANHAADLQKQSSDATLAYTKEQDALAAARAETDRRANFDQYQARARGAQSLGDALGFHLNLPDYVPGNSPSSGAGGGDAAVPERPKDLASAIAAANQIAYGGQQKHQDESYWAANWAKDPDYAWKRLLGWQAGGADAPTSGPYAGQGSGSAAPTTKNTIASYLAPQTGVTPFMDPSQSVLKIPPPAAFQPKRNTIGAYFGGRA